MSPFPQKARREDGRRWTSVAGWLPVLGALLILSVRAAAQGAAISEYEVKAAILFNIAKYTEFPAATLPPGNPVTIGVLGEDPFGSCLDRILRGRTINDHYLVVKRASKISDLRDANLVFVSCSERERLAQCCSLLESWGILTVADCEQAEPFAAVTLAVEEGKVVYRANLDAAERSHVHVSSKFLHLAREVRSNGPRGLAHK